MVCKEITYASQIILFASMSKYKLWVFIHFDIDSVPEYEPAIQNHRVFGIEVCSDTGRQHFQGF